MEEISSHPPAENDDDALPAEATWLDRQIIKLGSLIAWLFAIAVAITAYEVVMRYAFNAPTIWVHEATVFLVSLGFTYSGLYAMARGTHIRIGIATDKLPARLQRALAIVNGAILVVFFACATYAAYLLARPAVLGYESTGSAWDPHFPPYDKSFLILVMIVFVIQGVWRLVALLGAAARRANADTSHEH